ncbi:hypothetical protein PS3A_39540 [Pseudomonas sp. 3A(2025)]
MAIPKPEPLCRYRYDPLDRLASCLPFGQDDTRCFYRLNRLTTEIQGQVGISWLQAQDRLLAQCQQESGENKSVLIATDAPGSVIHALGADQPQAFGYMPYGTRAPTQAPLHLPGFNGERRDPVTGHYLLGNGYRAFNPVSMRFNSPDSLSPFGEGGLNTYGYCGGDPVNRLDPSGHIMKLGAYFLQRPLRYSDQMLFNDIKTLKNQYMSIPLKKRALASMNPSIKSVYMGSNHTSPGIKKIIESSMDSHMIELIDQTNLQRISSASDTQIKIHLTRPKRSKLKLIEPDTFSTSKISEDIHKIKYSYSSRKALERTYTSQEIEPMIEASWIRYQNLTVNLARPAPEEMRNPLLHFRR